jgi:hypothetical protein
MELYKLRAHKNLRSDLEAAAKYANIGHKLEERGDEIIISVPKDRGKHLVDSFFDGKWRKNNES